MPNTSDSRKLTDRIAQAVQDLPGLDAPRFALSFDRFADRRVVMLGEASHGTEEFYRARAAITRHLVEHHSCTIVAVEADWPDAAKVDRYVRHAKYPGDREPPFQRFPTWMWRNTEIRALIEWLRAHNAGIYTKDTRAGFYGLDIYNMSASIGAVLEYLDRIDPEASQVARERYGCLTPWRARPESYGRTALARGYAQCEEAVVQQCQELLRKRLEYEQNDDDAFLDAAQNARLIASAERYYRIMYYGGAESWNLRDRHMFQTLQNLMDAKGPQAKAIVWAHNSHVGDARYTEMGKSRDEVNIGQLARQQFGEDVALIGFGTHTGTVAASHDWDADVEVTEVNPSLPGSYERLCHDTDKERFLLDLSTLGEDFRNRLNEPKLQRFIGVIYRPDTERWSHYAQVQLAKQCVSAWNIDPSGGVIGVQF